MYIPTGAHYGIIAPLCGASAVRFNLNMHKWRLGCFWELTADPLFLPVFTFSQHIFNLLLISLYELKMSFSFLPCILEFTFFVFQMVKDIYQERKFGAQITMANMGIGTGRGSIDPVDFDVWHFYEMFSKKISSLNFEGTKWNFTISPPYWKNHSDVHDSKQFTRRFDSMKS